MENYHKGICEGEILGIAASWAASEFLCLAREGTALPSLSCSSTVPDDGEAEDGSHHGIRTWVLPISSYLVSPEVFVQPLERRGKKYQ